MLDQRMDDLVSAPGPAHRPGIGTREGGDAAEQAVGRGLGAGTGAHPGPETAAAAPPGLTTRAAIASTVNTSVVR